MFLENTLDLLQFHSRQENWLDGREYFNYHGHIGSISKWTTVFYLTMQEFQDKTIDSVLDFPLGFMNKSTALEYR